MPAIAGRRPGPLSRLRERLPRALTHHREAQPLAIQLFELAGLIFLTSIGIAIDAVAAWVLIAMPMTAIVVLLLGDLEAGRSGAGGGGDRKAAGIDVDGAPAPPGT